MWKMSQKIDIVHNIFQAINSTNAMKKIIFQRLHWTQYLLFTFLSVFFFSFQFVCYIRTQFCYSCTDKCILIGGCVGLKWLFNFNFGVHFDRMLEAVEFVPLCVFIILQFKYWCSYFFSVELIDWRVCICMYI